MAVAGRLNRESDDTQEAEAAPLSLRCWPAGRTSDPYVEPSPPSPPVQPMAGMVGGEDIIVTASRRADRLQDVPVNIAAMARQEELGDIKLFRLPEPVTVAANSQKQIAMIAQPRVAVDTVYRQRLDPGDERDSEPAQRYLVTRNRTTDGLGLVLPAGNVTLFEGQSGRRLVTGMGALQDRAIGDDVEIAVGAAPGIRGRIEQVASGPRWTDYRLTVTNDRPTQVQYEAEFAPNGNLRFTPRTRLGRRDGRPLWTVRVPANGSAVLRYRLTEGD